MAICLMAVPAVMSSDVLAPVASAVVRAATPAVVPAVWTASAVSQRTTFFSIHWVPSDIVEHLPEILRALDHRLQGRTPSLDDRLEDAVPLRPRGVGGAVLVRLHLLVGGRVHHQDFVEVLLLQELLLAEEVGPQLDVEMGQAKLSVQGLKLQIILVVLCVDIELIQLAVEIRPQMGGARGADFVRLLSLRNGLQLVLDRNARARFPCGPDPT